MDDQLRVSLDNVRSSEWDLFEDFANAFLISDFPSLRPIGGTNDKGRDAVLFEPDPQATSRVVLQYSLSADWRSKIRQTVKRLDEKNIPCSILVYATNREIGPDSDDLETELRAKGIALSIRDRDWWVARSGRDASTRHASEALKARVLGRIVAGPPGTVDDDGSMTRSEVETGLFFLELHVRDADRKRSLTRQTIEWLVLSALAETDPDHRRTADQVVASVARQMPGQDKNRIEGLVRTALRRLKNARRVTVSGAEDSYALHFSERQRIAELASERAAEAELLEQELHTHIGEAAEALEYPEEKLNKSLLAKTLIRVLQQIANDFGNSFAAAVTRDSIDVPRFSLYDTVETLLINDSRTLSLLEIKQVDTFNLLTEAAARALLSPAPRVATYLHDLSEAYTLRAFLRETPDVEDVVSKLFSRGQLVLDTTVLLPVFVEMLLPEDHRIFTNLLLTARSAGMKLICTEGVINEIVTHLQNSRLASQLGGRWQGPLPMVFDRWRSSGGQGSFQAFVDDFIGVEPEADIEQFLADQLGIDVRSLETEVEQFDDVVVARVTEIWRPRKRTAPHIDLDILLRHDVEMYLGVLGMRRDERTTVYGHEAWWVTLDTSSSRIRALAADEGIRLASDPVMHPNFLSRLLAVGPSRRQITAQERGALPLLVDAQASPWSIPALGEIASEIRKEYDGRPEYFLRRKLRERMNQIKTGREAPEEGEAIFD
jgi:hypothetical protein